MTNLTDEEIRQCAGSFDLSTFKDEPMVTICDELLEARVLIRKLDMMPLVTLTGGADLHKALLDHLDEFDGGDE